MGVAKTTVWMIFVMSSVLLLKFIPAALTLTFPISLHPALQVEERMFMPPEFPYSAYPPGYTSSGILCPLMRTPYIGGWFGRSCQGPIAPFILPTTTTTTTEAPSPAEDSDEDDRDEYVEDEGVPVVGDPWEPDDEELFIENYGLSAGNPDFRLGDPSRQFRIFPYRG